MIKNQNMLSAVITALIIALSGCASNQPVTSNQPDPKPYEAGQCSIIRQDDANRFEVSKQALIGKRYANFSKAKKDRDPQGPYILRDVSFSKLSDNRTWWQVKFNGQPIDVAETFIETSAGTFENLIVVQSQFVSGSCDPQALKFQKKLLLN